MTKMNNSIICLMGPTAAGKTALALQLANELPCEIISVDSAMIYRGMDIGTGKPDTDTLKKFPHHLIDICDAAESYSAARFCNDAVATINEIISRGKIPLLVGGTMLYFRALLTGLSILPTADTAIRADLQAQLQQYGSIYLHEKLQAFDPHAAERIHRNDPQRILRAMEVYYQSGKTLSEWHSQGAESLLQHSTLHIAIAPQERSLLHQRISDRFHAMLAQGLVEEVRALYNRNDLHKDLPSMRAVGYRQIWQYLEGELDYNAMQERSIIATRQLAKRQLTWLRSWPNLHWFDSEDVNLTAKVSSLI
ncbi:tRNA (adenosine(37)-N6)-dimethylallyltransferase MiaA [soil metagenome]